MPPRHASRRTTLAGLDLNRRMSFGPEKARAKRKTSRQSMNPRMAGGELPTEKYSSKNNVTPSRRKSQGADRLKSLAPQQAILKADPRPVSDKAYIKSCIGNLLQYLVSSGYEYPVTRKALAMPSGRDFNQIVTFLLKRIDPSFNNGTQKFEDEVAMAFKSLGYPYPISKTALVAAGSPHTWPTLLSALMWLIELLGCVGSEIDEGDIIYTNSEDTENKTVSLDEIETRSEKAFFRFLNEAYVSFLSGDDMQYEALEVSLIEYFEKDDMKIEEELRQLTEQNVTVKDEIGLCLQDEGELPQLKQRREGYAKDLEKFYDLVNKLEEHKATLTKKVEERTTELGKSEGNLERVLSKVEGLKEAILTQELSLEDVRRMQNEKARIEEGIARTARSKNELNEAIGESNADLLQTMEQLQIGVASYNEKALRLQLIPQTAENARGQKYTLIVQTDQLKEGDQSLFLGGVDLKNAVLPSITRLKIDYKNLTAKERQSILDILNEQETSEDMLRRTVDDIEMLESRAKELDEALSRFTGEQGKAYLTKQRKIGSLKTKIASISDPVALEAAISKYQNQCHQLEALRQRHHDETTAKRKAVQEELNSALQILTDQKEYTQTMFRKLGEYIQDQETFQVKVSAEMDLSSSTTF